MVILCPYWPLCTGIKEGGYIWSSVACFTRDILISDKGVHKGDE